MIPLSTPTHPDPPALLTHMPPPPTLSPLPNLPYLACRYLDYDILRHFKQVSNDGTAADAKKEGHQRLAAKIKAQGKVQGALGDARERLKAVTGAIEEQKQPAVPVPTVPVKRARKDAPNKYGCVVGFSECVLLPTTCPLPPLSSLFALTEDLSPPHPTAPPPHASQVQEGSS
jgi:hypothetical protein